MKRKLVSFISILLGVIFLEHGCVWAGCASSYSLRTMALSEKIQRRQEERPLSLQEYVHELRITGVEIEGEDRVRPLIKKAGDDIVNAKYGKGSFLAQAFSPLSLNLDRCHSFHSDRVRIICFRINPLCPLAYALIDEIFGDDFNDRYAFSMAIENNQGEMIGHCILCISAQNPKRLLFRYMIHGSRDFHPKDFTGQGYGMEALALLIGMANKGKVFPGEVREFQFLMASEDYDERDLTLTPEFLETKAFLVKRCDFIDESNDERSPLITFYFDESRPLEIRRLEYRTILHQI